MLDLSERQVTRHTNTYHKRLHLYSGLKNHLLSFTAIINSCILRSILPRTFFMPYLSFIDDIKFKLLVSETLK